MYLSPIQHGIQASHVVTKLFAKYQNIDQETTESNVLYDWAKKHVTKDLRVGGYQSNLQKIYDILEIICPIVGLPFEKFHEEQDALNGALTSVGFIMDLNYVTAHSLSGVDIDTLLKISKYELHEYNKDLAYAVLSEVVSKCRRA